MAGRLSVRRFPLVASVVIASVMTACASPSSSPTTTLTDPRHGHQVPIRCGGVETADCTTVAAAMLRYLPEDAAKVEGVLVEPLANAPAGAILAAKVTVDHEMAFSAGEQAYRVVQQSAGAELTIEIILKNG